MSTDLLASEEELLFPSSDGKRMSENTRQYEAIVTLKGNIEAFTPTDAFVAGDHMIYVDRNDANPTNPATCQAPDVYVAFGRPRGHRSTYRVWEEDDIFPQVVFEVLSPSNTETEMLGKRGFYFRHGAEEYYEFDPEAGTWIGVVRDPGTGVPEPVPEMNGHISPRLRMRFGFWPMELRVFRPDGTPFLSFQQLEEQRVAERRRADQEQRRADQAQRQAEEERRQKDEARIVAEEERQRAAEAQQQTEEQRRRAEEAQQQVEEERRLAEEAQRQAEEQRRVAEEAQRRAEEAQRREDEARQELERLRALLRTKSDPDASPRPPDGA